MKKGERRKQELLNYKDPMFVKSFKEQSWHFLLFDDIRKLSSSVNITINDIQDLSNNL